MRLTEWISKSRDDNENLDIFLQIVRLLHDSGKGQGAISPAFYEVDEANEVTYVETVETDEEHEMQESFYPPEKGSKVSKEITEKRDVFSLGLLLYYLFNQKVFWVERPGFAFKALFANARREKAEASAIIAQDSNQHSVLMQRMTAYDPRLRPTLKDVLTALYTNICKFAIIRKNIHTGEHYPEITRCFSESPCYKFTPEKEYVVDLTTLSALSQQPLFIPFRLVKKQYIIEVEYSKEGRWHHAAKNPEAVSVKPVSESEADGVSKMAAALCYCDEVYGIEGDALFCKSDGLSYEMGLYKHNKDAQTKEVKEISVVREGVIAAPERLTARILSILKEVSNEVYDIYCVAVYGNPCPDVIKTINNMFPETVRIYNLEQEDILTGSALYLRNLESQENSVHNDIAIP